jgi:DNA-binding transcriptional MerR regulator/methylmalonyl-CoA mutase cobalamin-binding subunit
MLQLESTSVPALYPISAVSKMTGISLDTLRAWERRYRAVTPKRSTRGRLYSGEQARRLILLRQLVDHGYAIGQVARVEDRGLQDLLDAVNSVVWTQPGNKKERHATLSAPVLRAIERYDYGQAFRELNRLAAALANPKDLVYQVALPLMKTVGERWHEGKCSIAQEHMVTSLLSGMLASLMRVHLASDPPARVLLATPCNELHGFPNLAAALLTAAGGLGIVHLGTDLPDEDIVLAARKSAADAVLLSLSNTLTDETARSLREMARKLPGKTALWLGGAPRVFSQHAMKDSRWLVLRDFEALEKELAALGARF